MARPEVAPDFSSSGMTGEARRLAAVDRTAYGRAMTSTPARVVVLASGGGSNLQAILDAIAAGHLAAEIVAVVSDRADAGALERARRADVPAIALVRQTDESRPEYDGRLAEVVAEYRPDVVVLAGWMRILTMAFLGRFAGRVMNLHPALPGELPGVRAIERAFEEHLAGHRSHSGVMVHLVPDEGIDDGPVILTEIVPIEADDALDTFAERVHAVEHRLIVEALARVIADQAQLHGIDPQTGQPLA